MHNLKSLKISVTESGGPLLHLLQSDMVTFIPLPFWGNYWVVLFVCVAMVAIPTGIISSSFINIVQKKEQREKFNKEEENRR
mgnify:CR=1 FL=1